MVKQRPDVAHRPGEQVVDTDDGVSALDQLIAQVRSYKSSTACDDCPKPTTKRFGGTKSHVSAESHLTSSNSIRRLFALLSDCRRARASW